MTAIRAYDFADRPSTLAVVDSPNPSRTIVSATAYRPFGPPSSHTLGNGLTEARAHGLRDQPDRITVGPHLDWDYETDPAGNPTAITDLLVPAASRTFAYQPVQHFLTCAAGPWSPPGADCGSVRPAGQPLVWAYDRIGNRLSESRNGVSDTYAYVANPCPVPADPDRPCHLHTPLLTQISLGAGGTRLYQHGPAGHLEQVTAGANVVELGSDAEGRLTALSRPAADVQAAMTYDGRSFLTRSTEFPPNPGGTLFTDGFETGDAGCWSDAVGGASGPGGGACFSLQAASVTPLYSSEGLLHRLARRPSAGGPETLEYHFSFGGRPIAQLSKVGSTATWRFLTADHLGTPVLATDLAGALVWRGGFEPFGADWQAGGGLGASENGIHLRLPGQWVDGSWEEAGEGVGVYYNVHRWYEAEVGRYTRLDPLLDARRDSGGYAYSLSNPLGFSDPLGLVAWKCSVAELSAGALFAGGVFYAECESACVGGKRIVGHYAIGGVGFGAGISVPIELGTWELEDGASAPDSKNLEGPFSYRGCSVTPLVGFAWSETTQGKGFGSFSFTPSGGAGVGCQVLVGGSKLLNTIEKCCDTAAMVGTRR